MYMPRRLIWGRTLTRIARLHHLEIFFLAAGSRIFLRAIWAKRRRISPSPPSIWIPFPHWLSFDGSFVRSAPISILSPTSMSILGLHLVNWLVIMLYFGAIIGVGLWSRRRVRTTSDFYQGGRSFGRVLTAFLNFGNMTDAGQAAGVTREIYRQGLQGVWFANLVLFHTPFQWFIAALQRRARYIGPADMFLHRFESRFLAGLYAVVLVAGAMYGSAGGYLLTGKTLQAMMVKPAAEYSPSGTAKRHRIRSTTAVESDRLHDAQSGAAAGTEIVAGSR